MPRRPGRRGPGPGSRRRRGRRAQDRTRANPLREQLHRPADARPGRHRPHREALAALRAAPEHPAPTPSAPTRPAPCASSTWRCCARTSPAPSHPSVAAPGLRAGLTSFIGREAEAERVVALLTASRLVTVVGPGGAGKTRLATEVGRAWQAAHGGGAWLVELAPVRDEHGVVQAVLAALGLREAIVLERTREAAPRHRRLLAARRDVLPRPYLLVVDNCEHLIDAVAHAGRRAAGALPRAAGAGHQPRAAGRSTARRSCPLAPLGLPAVGAPDSTRPAGRRRCGCSPSGPPRCAPGFEVDETTVADVVEIVRRLDGLPLAIELAAARLRVLPLARDRRRGCPTGSGCSPAAAAPRCPGTGRCGRSSSGAGTCSPTTSGCWPSGSPSSPAASTPAAATAVCADDRAAARADVADLLARAGRQVAAARWPDAGRATGCWRRSASTASSGWPSAATLDAARTARTPTYFAELVLAASRSAAATPGSARRAAGLRRRARQHRSRPCATSATPRTRRRTMRWTGRSPGLVLVDARRATPSADLAGVMRWPCRARPPELPASWRRRGDADDARHRRHDTASE